MKLGSTLALIMLGLLGARPARAQEGTVTSTPAIAVPEPASLPKVEPAPATVPVPAPAPAADDEPLAGFSDGTAFLRSRDNMFVMFPNGRVQADAYTFVRPTADLPHDTILLRRARLELSGWVGGLFLFNIAGDFALGAPAGANPVAQTNLASTDAFVGVAPWGDLAILQAGQFDTPFTLESRTSDKYLDFMEKSATVRVLAEPAGKELGVMIHGIEPNKLFYYSIGAYNGDGQNFRNVDDSFDPMGRAWIAPLQPTSIELLQRIRIGGSFWVGYRQRGALALASQSTQGGFAFLSPRWTQPMGTTPIELHQRGSLTEVAVELDAPIGHQLGARFELVHKSQELDEADVSAAATGKLTTLGKAKLDGTSFYVEAWYWIIGDDTIIGEPGLQLPTRWKKFGTKPPAHGVQVLARVESLSETITTNTPELGDPTVGTTKLTVFELGLNYWYSKRFRATFNYLFNSFGGDSPAIAATIKKLNGGSGEHEMLLRLGVAL